MYLKSDKTEGHLLSEHMNILGRNIILAPKGVLLYSGYIIILFSIIGFGYISSKILSSRLSVGELGLNGILFMTILSYLTNFLITHNYVHNSIFLIIEYGDKI